MREMRVSKTRLCNICIENDESKSSLAWWPQSVYPLSAVPRHHDDLFHVSSHTVVHDMPDISWLQSPLLSILHQWVISPGISTVLVPWKPSCFDSAASSSSGTGVSGVTISCGVFTGPLDCVAAAPFASWVPS